MFYKFLFYRAWAKLIIAYLAAFTVSFIAGVFLIFVVRVEPEILFEISNKRLSYAFSAIGAGTKLGIDPGFMLFSWNAIASFFTISLLYTASLFNRNNISLFPQIIRKAFCSGRKMIIFSFLPGYSAIKEESLRRLFVWVMIPLLGMILLGIESGLTVSTSAHFFGSYAVGFISFIPHGIVEIPTISFAGAITFTAHLLVKEMLNKGDRADEVFENLEHYKTAIPLKKCIIIILVFLLIAGFIEGHITQVVLDAFLEDGV